ncbi:hypothetical protein TH30_21140 [Thalassospira profundimaris]|uniref:Uncharacterized protein n=1 Tax=Thalassospira profundimaris TaxID=502049 RepID=A0A367WKS6_9PROT|nr:hypothetical protein TH30_21140 [Thalassospira profundimaris]
MLLKSAFCPAVTRIENARSDACVFRLQDNRLSPREKRLFLQQNAGPGWMNKIPTRDMTMPIMPPDGQQTDIASQSSGVDHRER